MTRIPNNITVEQLYTLLQERHPDKMLIDDVPTFERGKLAGHIEILLEIESLLYDKEEDENAKSQEESY